MTTQMEGELEDEKAAVQARTCPTSTARDLSTEPLSSEQ